MKLRYLIALGITVFVLALLLKAPAAVIYGWTQSKTAAPAVKLYGLQGTLSEGQTSGVFINEHPAFRDLHWQIKPLWLLLAHARFHIKSDNAQGLLDGDVSLSPLGTTAFRNLRASMAVKSLLGIIGQPYLPIDGQINLDLDSLQLKNNLPTQALGHVIVHDVAWTLAQPQAALGDFRADISTDGDHNILVKITSISGALDVKGDARLAADRSYELHLQYQPKASAEAMVRNLLSSSGAADAQGWYHFDKRGKLP
ncbi:MAG: type II secretion system protein N [Stenotrophobium sp.]